LIPVDLVAAEVVYVLESVYEVERERVAELVRAIVGFPAVVIPDEPLPCARSRSTSSTGSTSPSRTLAACAEASGVGVVASFDGGIDRVPRVQRLEPSA
jgi:hypothetical protein